MKPVFVTCNHKTYNLDPEQIEAILRHAPGPSSRPSHGLARRHGPILECAPARFARHRRLLRNHVRRLPRTQGWLLRYGLLFDLYRHYIVTARRLATTTTTTCNSSESLMNQGRDSIYLNIDDDANCTQGEALRDRGDGSACLLDTAFVATELEAASAWLSSRTKM